MKAQLLALVGLLLMALAPQGALAWRGGDLGVRNQMAMNAQVANIYSAVNGDESTFAATQQNAAIASEVPYGSIPSLYLTTSYGDGDGYYWGGSS